MTLELEGLTKVYKDKTALDDVSFSFTPGIYGLLGPNGAGKSTTIRMMLTLIKPSSGEIKLFGKELQANRHEILQQTGAIIERPDMYKYLSAYDNLSIFAKMSGVKNSRKFIMERLDMVGLAERSISKVKTYRK